MSRECVMIYILFSADYELFLGENYLSADEILIIPTNDLLKACSDLNIKFTFFFDTCCMWAYKKNNRYDFPKKAETQMMNAIKMGHDVQTHIHPHWLFTKFIETTLNETKYQFDSSKYLLGTISDNAEECQHFIDKILKRNSEYLSNLFKSHNPSYESVAFRAGGYGIQPNTELIMQGLENNGYLIDSSVVSNFIFDTNVTQINFKDFPDIGNYWLNENQRIGNKIFQGIFEIPIASVKLNLFEYFLYNYSILLSRYRETLHAKNRGKGIPELSDDNKITKIFRYLKRFRFARLDIYSSPYPMIKITEKYLKRYYSKGCPIFFSINCHPKSMNSAHLDSLKLYCIWLEQKYANDYKIITFQEASKIIMKDSEGMISLKRQERS
jgi:hypothetical protein